MERMDLMHSPTTAGASLPRMAGNGDSILACSLVSISATTSNDWGEYLMGARLAVLFAIIGVNISAAGEKHLTGNFQWDVLQLQHDTVTASASILVRTEQKENPFYNGLYSLILPGTGQFRTERYTKSAIFLCAEAALAAYAIINNHNGNKKTAEFQTYAEAHWEAARYAKWIETFGKAEYGPTNVTFTQSDYDAIKNLKDFSKINEWEQGQHKLGFSHQLPKFGEQQYYELIGKYNQFKFGWDTYPDLNNDGIPDSDNGRYDDLIPQQLKNYAADRGKANDYYYAASFAVSALVINHVISAVDAFLTTKSYNSEISATMNLTPVDGIAGKRLLSQLTVSFGL